MTESTATPDVYRAITDVTAEMAKTGISKDQQNQQQGYRFRGIDAVYNGLSAVIARAGLCILPRVVERTQVERQTLKGTPLFCTTVRVEYDLISARDGSKHVVSVFGEAMDSADKSTNKAMSAAYKYMALQAFCIPVEGMEDADAHTPEPASRQPQPITAPVTPKAVADAKIVAMKAGVLYRDTCVEKQDAADAQAPEPSPIKTTREAIQGMVDAFSRLRQRYSAVGALDLFQRSLAEHGFEPGDSLESADVLARARAIFRDLQLAVSNLETRQRENGKEACK